MTVTKAPPDPSLRQTPLSIRDVPVAADDPVVRAASTLIGGPIGRYARVGQAMGWSAASSALTLIASLMVAAGLLQKGHCVANGWHVPDVFWRACYSDLPFLYAGTPLSNGGFPYGHGVTGTTQPPLTGAVMWLVALLVPSADMGARQRWFFMAWAVLTVALLAMLVRTVARSSRRDPWRAAHVAASPILITVALVAPDLLGVTLAAYGLYLWSRQQPVWAGVLLGLAVAARTYPILLILVLGMVSLRAGRIPVWAKTAGTALLTYVGTLALLAGVGLATGALRSVDDVSWMLLPYQQWINAGPDYGSLWYLPHVFGVTVGPSITASLTVIGWVLAVLAGALVTLSAPHRPTIAEVSLIVVGIVLLTGRSLPVQTALWVLPLLAMTRLRWRDHLIWASCEILYFVAIWLYLAGQSDPNRALPLPWLMFFATMRLLAVAWLVAMAWRHAWRRSSADPDPVTAVEEQSGELSLSDLVTAGPQGGNREPRADHDGDPEVLMRDAAIEPDELAGPLAGRADRMIIAPV
ncbi:hypothetical protein KEM60_00334 [Austwickia sp. TVS 96-490-7B]|uniref:glycosyltransferase family 87 protein n=1 Tax=Austwickia sp. TVS 96-490-7B TaxID=2830843 RepID=UPI001C56807E|nr:glycosyltransferase family 87 protein [Austwickia sp. TVS 96-490-7B]MBW3084150.1 hypothetical protein [Austwickia sp. TVS 96-490-7B]